MKKVGILYDNISGNTGDVAVGISVRNMLTEMGIDYEELVPGRFNPYDYQTIIIGGGYLLQQSPHFFYDKFRIPGRHILNCCGINHNPDDLNHLNDYPYVTVRSTGDKEKIAYVDNDVKVMPCTTMLLKDLPNFNLRIRNPSLGVHVRQGIGNKDTLIKYLTEQPFHIYFLPITYHHHDYTYMANLSKQLPNSTLLPILRPEEIFTVIGQFDYFITMSLHGSIFAYVHNVPFLSYEFADKQRFFMEDRGLASYLFRDLAELKDKFTDIRTNKPDYSSLLANDLNHLQEHKVTIREIIGPQVIIRGVDLKQQDQETALQQRNFQVHYLQSQVEALAAQPEQHIARIANLELSLKEKTARVANLEAQLTGLRQQVTTLEAQLSAVYSSYSWRIAAPLRGAYGAAKCVLRNTRRAFILIGWLGTGQFSRAGSALVPYYQRYAPLWVRNMVPPRARQSVSNALSRDHQTERDVSLLGLHLRGLGLTERAYAELHRIAEDDTDETKRGLAAWELAVWHADKYTVGDAAQCLHYLATAQPADAGQGWRERCDILAAECYSILGREEDGRQVIQNALSAGPSEDLYLAAANLENSMSERLDYINRALEQTGASPVVSLVERAGRCPLDAIHLRETVRHVADSTCKATVIVPAHNAEGTIETALSSLLAQTWQDIEILVVDDGSTDTTADLVERYAEQDSRVSLVRAGTNRGPFVARNLGLQKATGDFITCHDSDDWCHPERVETQARDLLADQTLIGNASRWTRMTNDLRAYRRGNPGFYIQMNFSSLMFRREILLEALGAWDSVRFGADTELWLRAQQRFGTASIRLLPQMLAFGRTSPQSLTENQAFGCPGYYMGARREYYESYQWYYRCGGSLYYSFPQISRPFPVPGIMRPEQEPRSPDQRRFELVLVSDFRVRGNCRCTIDIIERNLPGDHCIGLVQLPRYDVAARPVRDELRAALDGNRVQMLVYGEEVTCDTLVVFDSATLREVQKYIPSIKASRVFVIITRLPGAGLNPQAVASALDASAGNAQRFFGSKGTWVAANSHIKNMLTQTIGMYACTIALASQTWEEMGAMLSGQAAQGAESIEHEGRDFSSSIPLRTRNRAHEGSIQCIDGQDLACLQYADETGVAVIMPCTDAKLGMETAKLLVRRADMPCSIFIVIDSSGQGFVRTINDAATRISARYIVYLAQDAYPGRDWLHSAYRLLEQSGNGLLGFNDGKWKGRIASFGMVRTQWANGLYGGAIFYPGYRSHKADNELTVIARALDTYHYAPDCVLVEYDPHKDFGGSNPVDDRLFRARFDQGFDGLVPRERLRPLEAEYFGKLKRRVSGS